MTSMREQKKKLWRKERKNRVRRSRGKMAAAILLFCCLAFCCLFWQKKCFAFSGTEESKEDTAGLDSKVDLNIKYGYENMAKGDRCIPVEITLENNRDADLNGIIKFKAMESDGVIYQYDYEITLPEGEKRTNQYYIPIGTNAQYLYVTLEENDGIGTWTETGNVIASRQVKLNISQDVPELFIGLLSDRPENLDYLNGVGVSYSTLRTRSFVLKQEAFPVSEVGLNLLDVIVVNDYTLRNLSEQQTAAIMDWVYSGGILILGTGQRVDDTLGRFAPELLDDSYGMPNRRHINLGEAFPLESPDEGMMELVCVDIPLHGGSVILSSNGFALLTAAAKEQGVIAVASFDLGEIGEFAQNHPSYVDHFFTSLLGENRINRLAEVVYSGNSAEFWSVQRLINTGNVEKLPNLSLYVAIVVIYLLLLGPGLYLFLKNRELQVFYRRGVVGLSLIFAVLIYLMGTTTRFKSTFYTYTAIRDVTEDYITDTTYVNIRNPYNRPYDVKLNPSYFVLPITRSYQYGSGKDSLFNGTEPYQIAIERGEGQLAIRGQHMTAFTPRYFELRRKTENVEKIGIVGDVVYFEGKISGTITNHFPFPLENTALLLYGNMVLLGRLEPGESCKLDERELWRFPLNHSYVVAEQIIGRNLLRQKDIGDAAYLLAVERSNMLTFYLDSYMSNYNADARVIAFSAEKEEGLFLQEEDPETYGHTMLTSSISISASKDRQLYRSVLMKTPKVISGVYHTLSNSMSGIEPLTLEYQMGTEIEVESLTFEPVSKEFLGDDSGNLIEIFTGSVYFYNYSSGNFDRIEIDKGVMDVKQLSAYLSPGNTLTVRYVYDGPGSYNEVQLPMPMVAGRER